MEDDRLKDGEVFENIVDVNNSEGAPFDANKEHERGPLTTAPQSFSASDLNQEEKQEDISTINGQSFEVFSEPKEEKEETIATINDRNIKSNEEKNQETQAVRDRSVDDIFKPEEEKKDFLNSKQEQKSGYEEIGPSAQVSPSTFAEEEEQIFSESRKEGSIVVTTETKTSELKSVPLETLGAFAGWTAKRVSITGQVFFERDADGRIEIERPREALAVVEQIEDEDSDFDDDASMIILDKAPTSFRPSEAKRSSSQVEIQSPKEKQDQEKAPILFKETPFALTKEILKQIKSIEGNERCADCGVSQPTMVFLPDVGVPGGFISEIVFRFGPIVLFAISACDKPCELQSMKGLR